MATAGYADSYWPMEYRYWNAQCGGSAHEQMRRFFFFARWKSFVKRLCKIDGLIDGLMDGSIDQWIIECQPWLLATGIRVDAL